MLIGEQHREPVDAEANTAGRRHAVFERTQEVVVDEHGFIVAAFHEFYLFFKTFPLLDGVVQFAVGVGDLFAVAHEFEAFHQARFAAVLFRQRAHLHRVIGDEGGLNIIAFAFGAEDLVDQLALTHLFVGVNV